VLPRAVQHRLGALCQQETFVVLAYLLKTTPEADTAYGPGTQENAEQ
jgi:hypothetical protein